MMCWFYSQVVRGNDHDRSYAVRVWRITDWFQPDLNIRGLESIEPTIEFKCADSHDAIVLERRLKALREALEETVQTPD